MIYQHGDVILEKVEVAEGENVKAVNGQYVLAEGEATGHAHTVVAGEGVSLMTADDGGLLLATLKEVTIKHQEHHPLTLPAGKYKIRIVREYDYDTEEAREVRD